MTFENVAINDGRVAGLQFIRNFVIGLYLRESCCLFRVDRKADCFQVLAPAFTATSARRLEDLDRGQGLFAVGLDCRAGKANDQSKCQD